MDDMPPKFSQENCIAGRFGQHAEAFARSVAVAQTASGIDAHWSRDGTALLPDPRVLAAVIALEEDR